MIDEAGYAELLAAFEEGLTRAGLALADQAKRDVGQQGSAKDRSKPGEYPRKQTGALQESIESRRGDERLVEEVAAAVHYAAPLQFKPPNHGGRPHLFRTLDENHDLILDEVASAFDPETIRVERA